MTDKQTDEIVRINSLLRKNHSFGQGWKAFLTFLSTVPREEYIQTMFSHQFGDEVLLLKNPSLEQGRSGPVLVWESYTPKGMEADSRITVRSRPLKAETVRNIIGELEASEIARERAKTERERLVWIARQIEGQESRKIQSKS